MSRSEKSGCEQESGGDRVKRRFVWCDGEVGGTK